LTLRGSECVRFADERCLLFCEQVCACRIVSQGEAVYRKQREIEGYEIVQLMAELVFERTVCIAAHACVQAMHTA
jgi:hypothetical protein